ncbi:MAG: hypothetical protein KDD89_06085, partial [Anaerolineales bacterium]|nr:hypothetical protein [Anaerolineales bacterium]
MWFLFLLLGALASLVGLALCFRGLQFMRYLLPVLGFLLGFMPGFWGALQSDGGLLVLLVGG